MKKIYRILSAIVIILTAVLIGLIIGKTACRVPDVESSPKPTAVFNPDVPAPTEKASDAPDSAPTPLSSKIPAVIPEPTPVFDPASLPFSQTEGTLEECFARLEKFKLLPRNAKLILLDVGHGGFDGGAPGIRMSASEADLNLSIARCLSKQLGDMGYYVFMTRMGDYGVAADKSKDMAKRTEIMHLDIFDASVSIHIDSFPQDASVHGTRVYIFEGRDDSKPLANSVLREIIAAFNPPHQWIYNKDFMTVREPAAPAVLVECGFITNKKDEENLNKPEYQQQMAEAIAKGMQAFLEGQPAR